MKVSEIIGKGCEMGKRTKIGIIIAAACVVVVTALIGIRISTNGNDRVEIEMVSVAQKDTAYQLIKNTLDQSAVEYQDFLAEHSISYDLNDVDAFPAGGEADGNRTALLINYDEEAEYLVEVSQAGLYYLKLDYSIVGNSLSDYRIAVSINGRRDYDEMGRVVLPQMWSDETKIFPTDRYGDETIPSQVRSEEYQEKYLYNSSYNTAKPLLFYLEQGKNSIVFRNESADGLVVERLSVVAPRDNVPDYRTYRNMQQGSLIEEQIVVNGVDYSSKNETAATLSSVSNSSLTPFENEYKKLNVIKWTTAGVEINYELKIPATGFYHIAFHYRNEKSDLAIFESIYIDGEIPFKELESYLFAPTDTDWRNEFLQDREGNPYEIYLTEGIHTLTIRSEQEPVSEVYSYARLIAQHVTQFSLELKKITGPAVDKNRTWEMTKYIPEIVDYLEAYETIIQYMRQEILTFAGNDPDASILSELESALRILEKLKEYPDEIALYSENLAGSSASTDNSILKLMGDFSSNISDLPFALDMIYVTGGTELPKENQSFFEAVHNNAMALLYSFISEKYKEEKDGDYLTVWVNRSVSQVDLLQKMADTGFTPQTGIEVKFSVMPDPYKLTLAAAANDTPDVALGLLSHLPFELASRGAAYDLTQFEDFWTYANNFAPGAIVPFVFNEGVYAVPETSDFALTVYRKDIFEQLQLEVPDTWEELIGILPELQRYGMNFYHNIATVDGYKWFYQTAPMIYQNGGRLYTEDGLHAAIDEPNSVNGLKALGELFSLYSVPTQVSSFFDSFRYGIYPIGIVTVDSYNLISNGAPELEGQWELAPYIGTLSADGTVDRSYIAAGSGGMIFQDTQKANEAWTFLKWWLSHDVQSEYANTLAATYGDEYIWIPSNLEAIADCILPMEHKQLILNQIEYLTDVPRTPGQYLLERDISNIWNAIALNGVAAQAAIDEKILEINREIIKKMSDIGFADSDGNMIKDYTIHEKDWIEEMMKAAKGG